MKVACDGWYDQFARAPANRASSQCHEIRLDSLLESYSCRGRVAQLGEHLLCKQGVTGSIPVTSTKSLLLSLLQLRPQFRPLFLERFFLEHLEHLRQRRSLARRSQSLLARIPVAVVQAPRGGVNRAR